MRTGAADARTSDRREKHMSQQVCRNVRIRVARAVARAAALLIACAIPVWVASAQVPVGIHHEERAPALAQHQGLQHLGNALGPRQEGAGDGNQRVPHPDVGESSLGASPRKINFLATSPCHPLLPRLGT